MSKDDNSSLFDEGKATKFMDLYSRQIGTFGVETMKNLTKLSVLIVGMRGVGVEAAKNVILAGPKAVTIHDDAPTEWIDLGTNFFLKSSDIGKPRSKCVVDQLALLNPFVEVNVMEGNLTPDRLLAFGSVVVTCNLPIEVLIEMDQTCRSANPPIQFLLAINSGVVGSIFTDYGPSHVCTDLDGEIARVNVIEEIEVKEDEKGPHIVVTVGAQKHGLDDDQEVEIDDVKGMEELNRIKTFKVKRVYQKKIEQGKPPRDIIVPNKLRFDHPDAKTFNPYISGGNITEVKVKKTFEFKSLKESLEKPKTASDMFALLHPNEEKMFMGGADQIHIARLAMWAFQSKHGHFPRLHNKDDANECVALAKEIVEKHKTINDAIVVEVNEDIVRNTTLYNTVEVCGITAFLGGVIAQEVIKKFGKYTPVHQWIHIDYFEVLQPDVPKDSAPVGGRYDNQIAIFGSEFQDKIGSQRWFMVGCGALGCEYLKGFALMGLGTKGGKVFVTDMDRIEVSNLNRQFLFRKENVGHPKSVTAAAAARVMNPEINIECFETPVGEDTENFFHDGFWENLDGVCNALDNIKAREYVDSRCVFFRKPLLESGTLGTKANSEIILPFKTKSYREHEKNHGDEESIPMCTLRNFPHLIEHCIEWSRAQFTEVFEDPPKDLNKYLNDKEMFFKQVAKQKLTTKLDILESVKKLLGYAQKPTFTTAIHMAFDHFNAQFRDRILNLIFAFPQDFAKKDDVTGEETPFWSGAKRFPQAALFHLDDELFLDYLYTASNLYAFMLKVPYVRDRDEFKALVAEANLVTPEWTPSSKFLKQVKSEVERANKPNNEQQQQEIEFDDDEARIAQLMDELKAFDPTGINKLEPADFEKDDDSNFHIDYITACSNMRAWNYHIPLAKRHKCKMVAGRIIPAVATTTAMVTGLIEMELYKILLGLDKPKFLGCNVNLGVSSMRLFEPVAPKQAQEKYDVETLSTVKPVPPKFTCWDKVIIDRGDLTVGEFLTAFPDVHFGCTIDSLFFKTIKKTEDNESTASPIWVSFPINQQQRDAKAKNEKRKISEMYIEQFGPLHPSRRYILLDALVRGPEGDDVTVPLIQFNFK